MEHLDASKRSVSGPTGNFDDVYRVYFPAPVLTLPPGNYTTGPSARLYKTGWHQEVDKNGKVTWFDDAAWETRQEEKKSAERDALAKAIAKEMRK